MFQILILKLRIIFCKNAFVITTSFPFPVPAHGTCFSTHISFVLPCPGVNSAQVAGGVINGTLRLVSFIQT